MSHTREPRPEVGMMPGGGRSSKGPESEPDLRAQEGEDGTGTRARYADAGSAEQRSRIQFDAHLLLFLAIVAIGILARTWELSSVPGGMYPDELVVSVDAHSLLHFGVDQNLVSYPVFLISWGEGTSALYAYLAMPFFATLGTSPFTYRLPMLISGLLTMPLVYLIGRQLGGGRLGLAAMFLLAISPWHVMLSRWALECNIFPFTFSLGFLCLLYTITDARWFVPAMAVMGLSLYAYVTAFAAVPIFLLLAVPLLLARRTISTRQLVAGLLAFGIVAAPIGVFLAVNVLHLESVHLGPLTMPRLPAVPRYASTLADPGVDALDRLLDNASIMARLLVTQLDGHIFNTVKPYGYLYRVTFPVALVGAAVLVRSSPAAQRTKPLLILAWLAAAVSIGLAADVNVNRINLIFIPLILCVAVALSWLARHSKPALYASVVGLVIAFGFFTRDYHGPAYRRESAESFGVGALPAIDFATRQAQSTICVTDEISHAAVLFSQAMNGEYYPQPLKYRRPTASIRTVVQMYPYTFGVDRCQVDAGTIYVLAGEAPPLAAASFSATRFGLFTVYAPR